MATPRGGIDPMLLQSLMGNNIRPQTKPQVRQTAPPASAFFSGPSSPALANVGRGGGIAAPAGRASSALLQRQATQSAADSALERERELFDVLLNQLLNQPSLEHGLPFPERPKTPQFIKTPFGTYQIDENGNIIYEESKTEQKSRQEREKLLSQFMSELGGELSPGLVAKIDETTNTLKQQYFNEAEPLIRQMELQAGRGGSPLADSMVNLTEDIAERAVVNRQGMIDAFRQNLRDAIAILQSGGQAQDARQLQSQGLGAADQFGRQNLATGTGLDIARSILQGRQAQAGVNTSLLQLLSGRDFASQQLASAASDREQQRRDRKSSEKKSKFNTLGGIGGTLLGAFL